MTRPSHRHRFTILGLLALCCIMAGGPARSAPLNVVLIVADDLGAHDLGCTGSTFHHTPHLDRLAAQGLRFTQAYAACTVCSPTRAAILTGKYPARLRVTDWIPGHDSPQAKLRPPAWVQQLPLEEVTIAEHLRQRGYRTAHLGKWHLGNEGFAPENQGFDLNLGGDHRGQPPGYFSPYRLPRLPDGPAGEYLTDREGREAAKFIEENKDRAFFLNYWPYAVHTPLQAPSTSAAGFQARVSQVVGSQTNATYAAMLQHLDAAVGRLLQALDDCSVADHTLVIFTADNGGLILGPNPPTSNAPLRSGKGSPYEGGHRVPFLVRWTGNTKPGSTCAVPVCSVDLLPTILAAIGETNAITPRCDGLSLLPLLRDSAASLNRDALFWHYPHYHPGGATPYAAVRSSSWKLVQFYESGRHELFNLDQDPGETANLADDQPDRVMTLARKLAAWQNDVGAQWPMANPAWEPAPIHAGPDGSLHLHARDAKVQGENLRFEPQPFKNTLGYWTKAEDWVSWRLTVPNTGAYRIDALFGCGTGSGGSRVRFQIGDDALEMTVNETGGFQSFTNRPLGELRLTSGPQTLVVRPVHKPGLAVMDLREVVIRPTTR